jgi:hypothetical protein
VANSLRKPANSRRMGVNAGSGGAYPEYTVHVVSGSNYLKYFNYFEGGIFRGRYYGTQSIALCRFAGTLPRPPQGGHLSIFPDTELGPASDA